MPSNILQTLAGFDGGTTKRSGLFGTASGGFSAGQFSEVAGAATQFGSALFASGVAREAKKTARLTTEVNTRRVARQARYDVSLGVSGNAALGNTAHGSFIFVNAQNEREAQERVEDERIRGRNQEIEIDRNTPDLLSAGVGFAASLAGSFAGGR